MLIEWVWTLEHVIASLMCIHYTSIWKMEALHCLGVMVGDSHVRQILGKINVLPHQELYHTLNMDAACTVGGVTITGLVKRSPNC